MAPSSRAPTAGSASPVSPAAPSCAASGSAAARPTSALAVSQQAAEPSLAVEGADRGQVEPRPHEVARGDAHEVGVADRVDLPDDLLERVDAVQQQLLAA